MDAQRRAWVECLLEFPSGRPYAKYGGAHWRLVELADLGPDLDPARIRPGVEGVLGWLDADPERGVITTVRSSDRPRLHASIPGNAVYACTALGFGDDPRVASLVEVLLATQWPDGGWNCDRHPDAHRSSFHETVTPAIGLATYGLAFARPDAFQAAVRSAGLLLDHRLFRRGGTGGAIHPSWVVAHYPPYWHYDILQGLRLLELVGLLADERAADALDVLASLRRGAGFAGASWASSHQPSAVNYGSGSRNLMLSDRAEHILAAAGRTR